LSDYYFKKVTALRTKLGVIFDGKLSLVKFRICKVWVILGDGHV